MNSSIWAGVACMWVWAIGWMGFSVQWTPIHVLPVLGTVLVVLGMRSLAKRLH